MLLVPFCSDIKKILLLMCSQPFVKAILKIYRFEYLMNMPGDT